MNRQRLLVVTQTLAMLQSFALAVLTQTKAITIYKILALGALQGLTNAFDMPGCQAFIIQFKNAVAAEVLCGLDTPSRSTY